MESRKQTMDELSLEDLQTMYFESSERKQDLITRHLLKRFQFFVKKHAGKKANMLNSYAYEDWENILNASIWEGFTTQNDLIVIFNILNCVNKALTSLQQNLSANKRGYFQETAVDFLESVNHSASISYEVQWINKMAIENALKKLPKKTRTIAELFLQGYPVLTNKWNEVQVGPCITKFVGLKDAAVYKHIDIFKYAVQKELEVSFE